MIVVNYIDREDRPTKDFYVTLTENKLKVSLVEEGIAYKELQPHDYYYIILRSINEEDIPKVNCFENRFFGNDWIKIISKRELMDLYGLRNYKDFLSKTISETSTKSIMFVNTGFLNVEHNILDAVICVYGNLDNFNIKTSYDVMYRGSKDGSLLEESYDDLLVNKYSLSVDGVEYKCSEDTMVSPTLKVVDDSIKFNVQKYNPEFTEMRSNDYDNDTLIISSDDGRIDNEIIKLNNGKGSFVFYPKNNYSGEIHIKVKYNSLYENDMSSDYKFVI